MRPSIALFTASILFVSSHANADTHSISSSFNGLAFDISGIRLDLPAEQSLKALNPNFRFKTKHWKDSQNQKVRQDIGDQSFATGNIMSVREGVRIFVTPWHSGNLIQQVTRQVSIKPDDQKPTVDDFVAATKAKYGEPTQIITKGIFGRQAVQIRYSIKDGAITNAPCFEPDKIWFNPRVYNEERVATYSGLLDEINGNHCDAILSVFYTKDFRNQNRIVNYGAWARDFRLEFSSFIKDIAEREAATQKRQGSTPKAEPKL